MRSPAHLVVALDLPLAHESPVLQDADVALAALTQFHANPAFGFSDRPVLEIARKAGHLPLATFDKAWAGVNGAQRL